MAHLTLNVLGELQVLIDDVPITWFESDKVRALLAYLAVEASHPHRRETLVGLLWPDYSEQAARHNLRQALFNLRLTLGDHTAKPPYLLITRDTIQFNRESDYSLDLDQFNAYFSDCEKDLDRASIDLSNHIPQLEEMVDLYRGEFLQHFYLDDSAEYEEWVLVQRESLNQRAINALTTLANECELQGDYQGVHRYALRQVELDPWREEAHCQIMRVLAIEGQRTAALAQFESCWKMLAEDLGIEPSKKTRDLAEQIRSGTFKPKPEPSTPLSSTPIHNLPIPLTPFIGREQELADLDRLVADSHCRCITLVGPGGIGKTRLALQAAEQFWKAYVHGVAFIPLASVGSIEAVIPAIANGIGFAFFGPIDPKIQLLNYLRGKQMLLIMDNVEHLLVGGFQQGTIADLLIEILQKTTEVKLLVTSREALNLQGEWTFEVPGLTFPKMEEADRFDDFSAVALFVQRARRACLGFEMNDGNKTGAVRLCRLVEGMPLAIELAATWVRILSPFEIAAEIEHSLDFLSSQMRDLPERHRSMRAVFDHSWQMLTPDEQRVLGRLSVFRGGFGRQAAERVASATLTVLSSLVIRSFLRRAETGRYDLHELVRQYAALRLAENPNELYKVREQHSLYYLGLLQEKDAKLKSNYQKEAAAELVGEMDNIRAAWDWSIANQKFIPLYQASATFMYLFEVRNWFKEGEVTFQKTADALRAKESPSGQNLDQLIRNAMLAHCGFFQLRQGRGKEAYAILSTSAAFLRTSAEPSAATYSLWYLGIDCWILGRFSVAKESLQESYRLARHYGLRWYEAWTSEFLGRLALEQGEYTQAKHHLSETLSIIRQLGDPSLAAHTLSYLGRTMQILGESREAEKLLRESLEIARETDYRFAIGLALDGLGQVAYAQGNHQEAQNFFSESASLFREMGDTHRLSRTLNHQGFNSLALGDTVDAQNDFNSALRMTYQGGFIPSALNALTGLATLETRQKPSHRTLQVLIYIVQHPACTQETKDLSAKLREELGSRLSQEEIELAHQHAGSKNLDDFIQQAIAGN